MTTATWHPPTLPLRWTDYSQFYILSMDVTNKTVMVERATSDPPDRKFHGQLNRGEVPVPASFPFKVVKWRKCNEIRLFNMWYTIVAERFFAVLEQERFTGWTSAPAEIIGLPPSCHERYRLLIVTGRAGLEAKALRRPAIELQRPPIVRHRERWVGYYFDGNSWDGSDFFTPAGTYIFMITERVKRALDKHHFPGLIPERVDNSLHPALDEFPEEYKLPD